MRGTSLLLSTLVSARIPIFAAYSKNITGGAFLLDILPGLKAEDSRIRLCNY
jgi:hypothetical protein